MRRRLPLEGATMAPLGCGPNYHADYYCAFVLDPDGHRIEAVCHAPQSPIILTGG